MAGSVDTKDPLGLEAQLQQTKTSMPDPLGLEAQLKKKSSTENALPSGVNVSGGGSDAFLPSQQQQMPIYPMATPALRETLQKDDQRHIQESLDKEQRTKDASAKLLQDYYKHLSKDDKVKLESTVLSGNRPSSDEIHQATPEEIADEQAMDTAAGKALKTVESLGSSASKGVVQIAKGAAYLIDKSGLGGKQFSQAMEVEKLVDKDIDKATDLGLTPNDKQQIEEGKGLGFGALRLGNMLASFAPAAMGGGATFALQGMGQGKETIDHAEEQSGVKVNPYVKDLFILGNGLVNGLLMGDAGETILGKMPASLRGNIVNDISAEALKNATSEATFKELLTKGTIDFAGKFQKFGIPFLERFKKVTIDLAGLTTADWMLKKGVDQTTDKPVFNETPGKLAENLENVAKQAPILAGFGSLPELTKLTPYSDFKNDIVQHIADHPEDAESVKQDMVNHGVRNGWTPDEIKATNDHITQIAEAASKLPPTIKPEKKADAVQLLMDRDKLQAELGKIQVSKENLDPAVKDIPSEQETYLTNKIEQANDKLADMVRGTKTTYSKERDEHGEETGKFLKTTWKDKKAVEQEDITPERHQLESIERDSNIKPKADEEAPKEGDAGEEVPAAGEEGTGQEAVHNQEKEVLSPEDQKAINYITHGLIVPEGFKENDPSARLDLGMKSSEKKKALSDISNGKYNTAPARKLIDKVKEFEKNNDYPIIEGLGGSSVRRGGLTSEDMAGHFEDAKANKIGELSQHQINEFNNRAKELGITADDVKDYENYQQSLRGESDGGTAKGVSEAVPESADDKAAGSAQAGSDKTAQKQEGVDDATKEISKQEGGGREHQEGDGSREKPKTGSSNSPVSPEKGEGKPQEKVGKFSIKKKDSDTASVFAQKIRSLQIKGKTYDASLGIPIGIYNGALEAAALVVEGGGKIADAIQAAVDHIKKNSDEDDEDKIRKAITADLSSVGLEDRYAEPDLVEANNAYLDAKVAGKFGIEAVDHIIAKLKDTNLQNIVNRVKEKLKLNPKLLEETRKKVLEREGGSEEDQAALLLDQYQLKAQEEALINQINKTTNKKEIQDLQNQLAKLQGDILDNAMANRMIGREASSVFRMRQVATNDGHTLENMRNKYMASKGLKRLTNEQEEEIRQAYQKIREAEIEVNKIKEQEAKTRTENERLQQENDALKKIIDDAKKKHATTQKGSKDRLTEIRSSIDNSKKELGKLFGNLSSGGILQPEIYKHLYNIAKSKAEEIYVKTKANIELDHLVKSVMEEIKHVAPDITEQDVRDAISGNHEKTARKPKTELQKNIAELKKQANLISKINDLENGIERETKKRGESSPEVKKLQKELADLKKELKISSYFQAMLDGTLDTTPKTTTPKTLDPRQENINRYKVIQRKIKEIQGKLDRGEFTTPAKEAKKFEKSDKLKAAEHELAVRKFLWEKARKFDMQKNRPWWKKLGDNILQWQRFAVLSYPTTLLKLIGVAVKGILMKPIQLLSQEAAYRVGHAVGKLTGREGASGMVYGKVRPESLAKFYSAFVRNFSIENLKNAFKGIDESDILYGSGKYMEDYDMGSGFYNSFLEMPGRSHGYVKSFLRRPETAFAHEQLIQGYIEKSRDIENQLKNPNLTNEQREKLEQEQQMYDLSNDETLERVNTLAAEHGKWAILMNKNNAVEKFRTMLNSLTGKSQPSNATKAIGFLAKTEFPILKLPVNYARRYFLYKYGLIKAITGAGEMPGLIQIAVKGTDDLTDHNKELLSQSLTYGSMGAGAFVAGYMLRSNFKKNKDGSVTVNGQKIPKIALDSPLDDSFLSGVTYGTNIDRMYGESHAEDWIENFAKSDIDAAKRNPFLSQLNYGFFTKVAQAMYMKDETRLNKAATSALVKKASDILEPGVMKEVAQAMDTKNQSAFTLDPNNMQQREPDKYHGFPRYLWETLKTGIPKARETVNPK